MRKLLIGGAAVLALTTMQGTAHAKEKWQKPVIKECSLGANDWCGEDVTCPADMPFVVAGGGGMPKASRPDHSVAMTMNVAIAKNVWRVRWQNLGNGAPTDVKVMIRVKCSDDGSAWGE